jgi:type I restriction enzyme, R subunit
VYSYSLKQGIRDGFLAPYKVVKVHIDRDVEGYRPEKGQLDRDGEEVEDRIYNQKDFDRTWCSTTAPSWWPARSPSSSRKAATASRRPSSSASTGARRPHAPGAHQREPDLVAENHRYVMRITGERRRRPGQLGNFIDPEAKYPVLVTTSRLLSTGVDAQTCRLIVLDREVGSMTEFKQIVGRGTRVHEDTGSTTSP